ncbi:hypothetical protein B0A52_03585 [Exophiala mesophila]|uniref:Oxidoreductase n=1 Tax=Exophiala mesophila TaxID=212818 RepID=A0A438N9F9_EXOME|nr:hypothetical protein B0A52_03585 [Exophiala mesophila]
MVFNPDNDIPDLSGKVVLVTGGNIGLGRETVLQISKHNPAHIYLAARSKAKAESAIAEIDAEAPNHAPISFLELDLSSFESVKQAASTLNAASDRLDILINNAGIMGTPPGTTKEGYEMQFGTNHMGHALLTKLLLPKLQQTATKASGSDVRVVTLASDGYKMAPSLPYPLDKLKTEMADYRTLGKYGLSKLANIHYTQELAKHNPDIKCIVVHPGAVSTNLSSSMTTQWPILKFPLMLLQALVLNTVQTGSRNQLWAAVSPEAKSGSYYIPVGKESHNAVIDDSQAAQDLWEWTENELKSHM